MSKYECEYCGIDRGGWHGCWYQIEAIIIEYLKSDYKIFDASALTDRIAEAGYAAPKEEAKDA